VKLLKLAKFRAEYFVEGSAPTMATLRKGIESGTIPGKKIGGEYYVDVQSLHKTGNALVDQVLMAS
jgi:hypothetical protein